MVECELLGLITADTPALDSMQIRLGFAKLHSIKNKRKQGDILSYVYDENHRGNIPDLLCTDINFATQLIKHVVIDLTLLKLHFGEISTLEPHYQRRKKLLRPTYLMQVI